MLEKVLENNEKQITIELEPFGQISSVLSVNGKTGKVTITAEELGAYTKEEISILLEAFSENFYLFFPETEEAEQNIKPYNVEVFKKILSKKNDGFEIFLATENGNISYNKFYKTNNEVNIEFLTNEDSLFRKTIHYLNEEIQYNNEKVVSDAPDEFYVGEGEMPEGCKVQFIPDNADNQIYTKKEIDILLEDLAGGAGKDVYTKKEVELLVERSIQNFSQSVYSKTDIDSKIYTKTEIDDRVYTKEGTETLVTNAVKENNNRTYTKEEVVNLVNKAIKESNNYIYTKEEVNNLIYTKVEVDNLISRLSQEITSSVYVEGGEGI